MIELSATPGSGQFWRGDIRMPHMSQVLSRHLHGEKILQHAGETAPGYMLTDEQVDQRRTGRGPSIGIPYRYIVEAPGRGFSPWTAFWHMKDLGAFLTAYTLTVVTELAPGRPFTVQLPTTDDGWLPVTRSDEPAPCECRV